LLLLTQPARPAGPLVKRTCRDGYCAFFNFSRDPAGAK